MQEDEKREKYYAVLLEETLSRTAYVKTTSMARARDIIASLYDTEEIVLDADNFCSGGVVDVEEADESLPDGCVVYTIDDVPDVGR